MGEQPINNALTTAWPASPRALITGLQSPLCPDYRAARMNSQFINNAAKPRCNAVNNGSTIPEMPDRHGTELLLTTGYARPLYAINNGRKCGPQPINNE